MRPGPSAADLDQTSTRESDRASRQAPGRGSGVESEGARGVSFISGAARHHLRALETRGPGDSNIPSLEASREVVVLMRRSLVAASARGCVTQ